VVIAEDLVERPDLREFGPGGEARADRPAVKETMGGPPSVSLPVLALKLLMLMRKRKGLLAAAVLCATLSALLSLTPYVAAAFVFVALLAGSPDWDWILLVGIAAVAGVVTDRLLFGVATSLSHIVAFATQRDLRFELAEKLARVPLGFTDGKPKGDIRNTLIDDIEILEDGMAHLIPEVGAAFIAPLAALLAMLVIDWRLAALVMLAIAIGMWQLGAMMKRGEEPTRDYFALYGRMATTAAEVADGLPTVRAFNQDEQATARASRVFAEMSRSPPTGTTPTTWSP
jgi:ATP-binding cassette subfamily B protein